jgi:2-oxoisovalerate dehydrogenase E1 component
MEADLFAPAAAPLPWKPEPATPTNLNAAQAINLGLRKILSERPESLVLGQDIGTYGGAFKVTEGCSRFWASAGAQHAARRKRVHRATRSASRSTGTARSRSFSSRISPRKPSTQITLNAATMRFRSGAACPLVLRFPCGGGLTFGSFHSQELESFFLSMPGLKALYPSTPQDAFNALLAAYEDNNPVILFEHKALYRRGKGPVAWDAQLPRRSGAAAAPQGRFRDLRHLRRDGAGGRRGVRLLRREYENTFDLFDLRALAPLKLDAIAASVARTGRLIVVHEGRRTHGFGAELVARLTEQHFAAQGRAAAHRVRSTCRCRSLRSWSRRFVRRRTKSSTGRRVDGLSFRNLDF